MEQAQKTARRSHGATFSAGPRRTAKVRWHRLSEASWRRLCRAIRAMQRDASRPPEA